jgi:hypothetical protein
MQEEEVREEDFFYFFNLLLIMMGWDYDSEPRPPLAYCSSPGWMWVESRGGDTGWW